MPVAPPLLARLSTLASLTQLMQGIGIVPELRPLDPSVLGVGAAEAAILGWRGTFEWLGVSGDGVATGAAALAARLAAEGRLVGVIAIDAEARELGVAVGLAPGAAIEVSLDRPDRINLERLSRLARIESPQGMEYALRAVECLGREDAGRRFFVTFRAQLDLMADGLRGASAEECRSIALIQLTRVLFLYFVQAKGWLDGQPDFLRRAVDDALARRRDLHCDLLRPLFFGTLNRPIHDRGQARRFGRIPFLNGGLFEPHPLERAWRGEIPTPLWRDAFDSLFERFEFCADEARHPEAIAPDMLGRVFEGLMAPDRRKASGTFYTPVRLVQRLVDSSLAAWLAPRLGCSLDAAQLRLKEDDPGLASHLRDITILDPAAGSGAFLLGALQRLAALRAADDPPSQLRRAILERNLFGVDENPMAVRLAELRLWLAVIAAEPAQDPEQVAPLPNLDGVVRQGDSLLDPAWFLGGLGSRALRVGSAVGALRQEFVRATGPAKREAQRRLRQAESHALIECLRDARDRTEEEIVELLAAARMPTLFEDRRQLDAGERKRLRLLRGRLSEIRRVERRVRKEGMLPWFVYEGQFGDILARGGFDLVVGNPPWVRAEQLSPAIRARLEQRYRWWKGNGAGFAHLPDLSVAFVERSMELLSSNGVLGLLLPAKLVTAGYGQRLRAALIEQHTVHTVADLRDDPAAAFEATTYPAALVAAKRAPSRTQAIRLSLEPGDSERIAQGRLLGGKPWILASPALLEAIVELRELHPLLGERFTPRSGVKTGANAIFLDPPPDVEPALLRRAIRGRDVRPFAVTSQATLLFPHDAMGMVLPRLPPYALEHLRQHEALLRVRTDYAGGPYWSLFRVVPALATHRVVWADIARSLTAAALTGVAAGDLVPLNSCYLLSVPDRQGALAISAWLNSTWCRVIARATADPASNGFARFTARVVAELPLPAAVPTDARLARLAERGAKGDGVQEELDVICAQHLGLSATLKALLRAAPGAGGNDRGRGADRGR